MLKLQKVDLTMSDVFGIWLEMDLQLKQIAKKNRMLLIWQTI